MKKWIELPKEQPLNTEKMSARQLEELVHSQQDEINNLKQEISNIMSMIRLNNATKFGSSGDNVPYPDGYEQLSFFNEAEKYGQTGEPEPTIESATQKVPKKPKERERRNATSVDWRLRSLRMNFLKRGNTVLSAEATCMKGKSR